MQHWTVLIIFHEILHIIITAQMMSILKWKGKDWTKQCKKYNFNQATEPIYYTTWKLTEPCEQTRVGRTAPAHGEGVRPSEERVETVGVAEADTVVGRRSNWLLDDLGWPRTKHVDIDWRPHTATARAVRQLSARLGVAAAPHE